MMKSPLSYIPTLFILSRKNARDEIMKICKHDLYTGNYLHGKAWSLEHIVPQSRFKDKSKINDLFNLSAIDVRLNSSRGNKKFGNVMGRDNNYGCKASKTLFCPPMGKGEVSRSIAYMIEQYGDLIDLENVIDIETLMTWNELFPPSDEEKLKNEFVYELQSSYNRFIEDHSLVFDIGLV